MKRNQGFTLIELLVVIGVIAILAAIVLVAVNPGRQFAQARDTQRRSDLYSLTNAIYQYAAEHEGELPQQYVGAAVVEFPVAATCIGTVAPCFDLGTSGEVATDGTITDTIVPTYIAEMPEDPSTGSPENSQYTIQKDANGRVEAVALGELTAENITVKR